MLLPRPISLERLMQLPQDHDDHVRFHPSRGRLPGFVTALGACMAANSHYRLVSVAPDTPNVGLLSGSGGFVVSLPLLYWIHVSSGIRVHPANS